MNGKWILGLVYDYIRTKRRNVVRPRERWKTCTGENRISQKASNGDRNILRESLPGPIIFMEIADCHNHETSYGTENIWH
jgi:hypothetical protein